MVSMQIPHKNILGDDNDDVVDDEIMRTFPASLRMNTWHGVYHHRNKNIATKK